MLAVARHGGYEPSKRGRVTITQSRSAMGFRTRHLAEAVVTPMERELSLVARADGRLGRIIGIGHVLHNFVGRSSRALDVVPVGTSHQDSPVSFLTPRARGGCQRNGHRPAYPIIEAVEA